MPDGAAIAAASMRTEAARIEMIGLNLVNASTPAYKRQVPYSLGVPGASFAEQLGQVGQTDALSVPHAPGLAQAIDFRPGALRNTGNPLDLAIEGDAFFELQSKGSTVYTRQGNFTIDASGRLQTADGALVQGMAGDIQLENATPRIDAQGRIFDKDKELAQLRLVRFAQPERLQPMGDGRFRQGKAALASPGAGSASSVRQGFIETSNVVAGEEMLRLVEAMRRFEGHQRVILWLDDMPDHALQRLGEF